MESSFRLWGSAEGDLIHPADCMHELLEQVRRHKVNIDGNVTTVMVTTLVLEVCCGDLMLISITQYHRKRIACGVFFDQSFHELNI